MESKRLRERLPKELQVHHSTGSASHPAVIRIRDYFVSRSAGSDLAASANKADLLLGFAEHLESQRNYLEALRSKADQTGLQCSVLTNGEWWLLLRRPIDVLTDPESAEIHVFGTLDEVLQQVDAFEQLLSYWRLSESCEPVPVSLLGERVALDRISAVCFAVEIVRQESDHYDFATSSTSATALCGVLLEQSGQPTRVVLVRLEAPEPLSIGRDSDAATFQRMTSSAAELRTLIEARVGQTLPLRTLQELSAQGVQLRQKLIKPGAIRAALLTGSTTAIWSATDVDSPHTSCSAHTRDESSGHPMIPLCPLPSNDPRTNFKTGDARICQSASTQAIKERLAADASKTTCVLTDFEQLCCCRSCSFLPVCDMRNEPAFQAGCSGLIQLNAPTEGVS